MDQAPGKTDTIRPGPERTCVFYQGSREPAARGQSLPVDPEEDYLLSKTKQRNRSAQRYARVHRKTTWYSDLPLLPLAVAALLLVGAVALVVYANLNKTASSAAGPIDGIPCNTSEQLAVHVHAHLSILVAGNEAQVPSNIGINSDQQCLYWLHTHDASGIIHIEAPASSANRKFKLGEFFDVWGKRLDRTHVGATTLTSNQTMVVFVDGKTYTGDPRQIVMQNHTQIVIEVGPPEIPPQPFTFPPNV
jgi:hypothetical protein